MENQVFEKIEVFRGDITQQETDAIVNAANTSLLGGGGVDGAIHRASGPQLLEECRKIGGCPTGEARITKGYRLKAKYVVHTVGPIFSGTAEDSRLLTQCYRNSLELAKKNNIKSISFPAISCGVYGYPIDQACKIAVDSAIAFLKHNPDMEKIVFVLFSPQDLKVYEDYIHEIRR